MKTSVYLKKTILGIPLVFGLVLIVFGIKFVLQAQSTKYWQQTQAIITQVNLVETTSSTSTTTSKQKSIAVSVVYRYQVNGKKYQSDKYRYGEGKTIKSRLKNRTQAQQFLAHSPYQKGREIKVYYNPNNPQQAVIKTGPSFWTYTPLIFGLFISSVFAVILWRISR